MTFSCHLLSFAIPVCAELPNKIQHIADNFKISKDSYSIIVQAVDEDSPRIAVNVDKPMNPASVIKLVTTWTALDILGPSHTWRTHIYALGPIEDGVLKGDLLIKGSGDPYLVIEEFWKLAGKIRQSGIQKIEGDLVIDNSLFAIDESDPGAFDGEHLRPYNVLPSPLIVNFNSLDFILRTNLIPDRVTIEPSPALPNLRITNRIELARGRCHSKAIRLFMETVSPDSTNHVIFSGELPYSCNRYTLSRAVLKPSAYVFGAFKMLWRQWDGNIKGRFREGQAPPSARPLVTWQSRQLGEIIRPLNKWSNNVMSRLLLYTIAQSRYDPPLTREQGARTLRKHLTNRGLDTSALVIDNGSGLSRDSRVTARFMVELLRLAWRSPHMPEYISSLSIAGKDGTTRRRFHGRSESGRMHLKTGRLDDVVALAGYVSAKTGKTFIVCMLANQPGIHRGPGNELKEALLAWTYRQG